MTIQMTESDVRDAIAYVRAYVDRDTDALEVLSRHGDHEAMLLAVTAIFAGHLLHLFHGDEPAIHAWMVGILIGRTQ